MVLLLYSDAVSGVEPQSETVWRQADKYGVPRIAFVNKMDRIGADFFEAVKSMREKLGANAFLFTVLSVLKANSREWSTSLRMRAYFFHDETLGADWEETEIPADLLDKCKEMRAELFEELATIDESNESFMHKVLENPDSHH